MPGSGRKYAIIGAGPIGLYLALRLYQKGVRDLFIIDLHAGEDIRPGHVHPNLVESIFRELGIDAEVPKVWHIRNVTECLLQQVNQRDITIIKQHFRDIQGHTITLDEDTLECDYVFDCSGSAHAVTNAVNRHQEANIFDHRPIVPDISIKQHFVAYISMDKVNYRKFYLKLYELQQQELDLLPYDPDKAQSLHALGWDHYVSPFIYAAPFKKDKFFVYMHMPEALPAEQHQTWFSAMLQYFCDDETISYQRIHGIKHGREKPYFNAVTVDPQIVNRYSYVSEGHATTIIAGDNLANVPYRTGFGIKGGMLTIDGLMTCLKIIDGKITGFSAASYQNRVEMYLELLHEILNKHYQPIAQGLLQGLRDAQGHFKAKVDFSDTEEDRVKLSEITARLHLAEGALALDDSLDAAKTRIVTDTYGLIKNKATLKSAVELLCEAFSTLPEHRANDKQRALRCLQQLAQALEKSGDSYYISGHPATAKGCYHHAVEIFNTLQPSMPASAGIALFRVQTSLVACLCQLQNYPQALQVAEQNEALLLSGSISPDAALTSTFISNYVTSLLSTLVDDDGIDEIRSAKARQLLQDPRLSELSLAIIKKQFAKQVALLEPGNNEEQEMDYGAANHWYSMLNSLPCTLL